MGKGVSPMLNSDNHIQPNRPVQKKQPTSENTEKVKPRGIPKTDKNFKKLMTRVDSDQDGHIEEEEAIAEEKESFPSLFELSAKKSKSDLNKKPSSTSLTGWVEQAEESEEVVSHSSLKPFEHSLSSLPEEEAMVAESETETSEIAQEETNSLTQGQVVKNGMLQGQIATRAREARPTRPDTLSLDTDATVVNSKDKNAKTKSNAFRESTQFTQENRGDLSYLNPNIQSAHLSEEAMTSESNIKHSKTIQELVNQLVKGIQVIQSQGETSTVVTLSRPPILEDAKVVLTAFESDSKKFNIAFINLKDQAKTFLDQQLARDDLSRALENRGLIVNAITTSTLADIPFYQESKQNFAREEQQKRQQQSDQQQFEEET